MKVLHFADVHLGTETHGRPDPRTGMSTRAADFLHSLDRVVDFAIAEADLVIFAGDAYKTRSPSSTYQREFARRILRLSRAGLPTVLVPGNHDTFNATGRAHTVEIFDTLGVENVYVASRPAVFDIETAHGAVQVATLPWVARSALLTRKEYKNKSLPETTALLQAKVESLFTGDGGFVKRLKPDMPHVLAAHGTVQGAVYSSERATMLGHDMIVPLSLFKNPHWDYVALGHIHKHQEMEPGRSPPVVYSGSIERIDFGEEKEDKGFVIADVERGGCSWTFRKLDTRRFVTIRMRADEDDPTAQIVRRIETQHIEGAVVRVIVQVSAGLNVHIDDSKVRRALEPAFHIASITHEVDRSERMRLGTQSDIAGLAPLDVLERYLQVKQATPERIAELRERMEQLLEQEAR
jgi:exonuclease SbcD